MVDLIYNFQKSWWAIAHPAHPTTRPLDVIHNKQISLAKELEFFYNYLGLYYFFSSPNFRSSLSFTWWDKIVIWATRWTIW